jgi:aryl-alcohol dehydrogenase-like predicted oxidoreductase
MQRKGEPPRRDHPGVVIATARAHGVTTLDTAPGYGGAEETIGAIAPDMRVHTKIDPAMPPAESLALSLLRLRRDVVDVLYLHDPAEVRRSSGAVLAEAHALVGGGARRLGASIYEVAEFDAAVADPRIGAVQAPMNLLDRRIDDERLSAAAERGVEIYARSILLQGTLAAHPDSLPGAVRHLRPYVSELRALAARLGRGTLELALGWVRARPGLQGMVIGIDSPEDLTEIARAHRAAPLTPHELDAVRALPIPRFELCDPRRWTRSAGHDVTA